MIRWLYSCVAGVRVSHVRRATPDAPLALRGFFVNFDPPTHVNTLHRAAGRHVARWAHREKAVGRWERYDKLVRAMTAAGVNVQYCADCLPRL